MTALMKVFKELNEKNTNNTAVALGLFDGVHRGHQKVISKAINNNKYKSAVLTFTTKINRPTKKQEQKDILTVNQRLYRLEGMGVDYVYIPDFEDIKDLTPEDFVYNILHNVINAKVVYCGQDYRFGKKASGDVDVLTSLCEKLGIKVEVIGQELYKDEVISSTRIRKLISSGQVDLVNDLLGYNYFIDEVVEKGYQLGRTINFPTINQKLSENICLLKFGVYISSVNINGKTYKSITNIGIKPTITGNRQPLAETHIIGYSGDLYGRKLKVELYKFVRQEQKFENIQQLKDNISRDVMQTIKYFEKTIDKNY